MNAQNMIRVIACVSDHAETYHDCSASASTRNWSNATASAKDPVERSHYQIIWLLAQGKRSEEVATVMGYSRSWIYEMVRSYNQVGPEALGDWRHQNPGASPLLNDVCCANLLQALRGPAPDGRLWNGRKVASYYRELLGVSISRQQGWEYLKQMELRRRVPRPSHQEADPDEQEAWKKKVVQEVVRIQQEYPDADVEIWCGACDAPPPVRMNIALACSL